MLLTVIIPVYNVEKYIKKCIFSVVTNDLSVEDYEIIVVDDGSPDASVLIVRKLMLKFPQIKLISQSNKGLGGARNTGIDNAKGDYVLFLDADDYLKKGALKKVVNIAADFNLDILEFGAIGVSENGAEVYRNSKSTDVIVSGFEYLDKTFYMNSACNKLYAVSFLNKFGLRFKERIFIEDFEFNTRAFYFANRVKAVDVVLGIFVQTTNSITRNVNTAKQLKMVKDIEEVIDLTIEFEREQSNLIPKVNKIFKERLAFLTITLLYSLLKLNIDKITQKNILKKLKEEQLYPIKTSINNRSKNLFRKVVNIEFLFLQLCNIGHLIKK